MTGDLLDLNDKSQDIRLLFSKLPPTQPVSVTCELSSFITSIEDPSGLSILEDGHRRVVILLSPLMLPQLHMLVLTAL